MSKLGFSQPASPSNAKAERFSVLLVDSNPDLRESRLLLLRSLPMTTVGAVAYLPEVTRLAPDSPFQLVVIALDPNERTASEIAEVARIRWVGARILLLGTLSSEWDDWLYDEVIDPHWDPAALLTAAQSLLQQTAISRSASLHT